MFDTSDLFFEVESESSMLVRLFATGVEQGRWVLSAGSVHGPLRNVSRLEPELVPLLRSRTAVEYVLCVSPASGGSATYSLVVAILEPMD